MKRKIIVPLLLSMSIFRDLHQLFFPKTCPVCQHRMQGKGEKYICINCASQLPLYPIRQTDDNEPLRLAWSAAPFEHGICLLYYRHHSLFHQILTRIKYLGSSELATEMGRWAAAELAVQLKSIQPDALVPVPLSQEREKQRGYNQARLLAQGMSEVSGIPMAELIVRDDARQAQASLNKKERAHNVMDIYRATVPTQWKGKRLMLVDDVFTTGATICACANAILQEDSSAHVSFFTLSFAG